MRILLTSGETVLCGTLGRCNNTGTLGCTSTIGLGTGAGIGSTGCTSLVGIGTGRYWDSVGCEWAAYIGVLTGRSLCFGWRSFRARFSLDLGMVDCGCRWHIDRHGHGHWHGYHLWRVYRRWDLVGLASLSRSTEFFD